MTEPVSSAPRPLPDKRAATAREFESVFAGQLAKLMLEQVEVDESFGGGHGEEMFRGVLAEELGKSIAAGGQLGLSPAILAAIQRMESPK